MDGIRILGTGSYVPTKVLANSDLQAMGLDTTDEWITSCAISLDEAVRDGSVKKGDLVCLPVFGGGLTWGSALIRW